MIKIFLTNEYIALKNTFALFNKRKGSTLSASCTFYFLLTVIPCLLVLIHLLSFLLGDLSSSSDYIFSILSRFFPNVAPEFLQQLQKMSWKLLFQKSGLTLLNFSLLFVSALSFFNSVWNSLFLISGNHKHNSFKRYLKGIGIIGLTIIFLATMIFLQPVVAFLIHFLQDNIIYDYLWNTFSNLRPFLLYLKDFNGGPLQILMFIFFIIYFTFFYRLILQEKISLKITLKSALIFSIPLLIGRFVFMLYINMTKSSMINNYGSFYSLVLALLWIYLLMNFFYLGACYSLASHKNQLEKE